MSASQPAAPMPRTHRIQRPSLRAYRGTATDVAYLVLAVAIIIGVWELLIAVGNFPTYVLPHLDQVWTALKAVVDPSNASSMWPNLWSTVLSTILGFAFAGVIGIVLGVAMGEFRPVRKILMPYIVALQSVPKAAIVPLIIVWAGYGSTSKVIIGFMLALFPVIVNTLQGISDISSDRINLVRALGGGRWRELRYVRLPSALPNIFVGLELAIVYSLLGVVVAEVLGAQTGLGVMIAQFETVSDTAGIFALLIVLAVIGFVLNQAVVVAHARLAWWDRDSRNRTSLRRRGRARISTTESTATASATPLER
jgi:NitT/TauT family transport system permease protein